MSGFVYLGGLARGQVGNIADYSLDGKFSKWSCFFKVSMLTLQVHSGIFNTLCKGLYPAVPGYTSFPLNLET